MSSKKLTKLPTEVKNKKKQAGIPVHGICGVLILFVCVSIGYANYRVFFGTASLVDKIMLAPSTLFVMVYLFYKSYK